MCDDLKNFCIESEDYVADINCNQDSYMFSGSKSLSVKRMSRLDYSKQAVKEISDDLAHYKRKSNCQYEEINLQNDRMIQPEHKPFIEIKNKPTIIVVSDGNDSESSVF